MKLKNGEVFGIFIPTSAFKELGDEPYTIAMRSLIGCTLVVIVKDYDPQDPNGPTGVYMTHLWEMPGFSPEIEDGEVMLDKQFGPMVKDFLVKGYPNKDSPNIEPKEDGQAATVPQDGITNHMDVLGGGKVFIMHPMKVSEGDDGQLSYDANSPNYPEGLKGVKEAITNIDVMGGFKFVKEFLYKSYREPAGADDGSQGSQGGPDPIEGTVTGRAIFEYVPDRSGQKYGRLIFEDGGQQDEHGARPGFWEFNFGRKSRAQNTQSSKP
jgi:hypothetical protein